MAGGKHHNRNSYNICKWSYRTCGFPMHHVQCSVFHLNFPSWLFILKTEMQECRRFNWCREQKCWWWVTDQVKRGILKKKNEVEEGEGWRNSSQDKWCVFQGVLWHNVCVRDMSNGSLTSDVVLLIRKTPIKRNKSSEEKPRYVYRHNQNLYKYIILTMTLKS